MGYCAVGSMRPADWAQIKKLCKQMQDIIDQKIKDLDTGSIKVLKERVTALENAVAAIDTEQQTQNTRLDTLEETTANLEITTSEVLEMYGGN